jgi:orotidine-5'-phosphate decarboxylase
MLENAADKLIEALDKKINPCVIGLDPRIDKLPIEIKNYCLETYGNTLTGAAKAIEMFCCEVIDTIKDIVAVVKPQIAFFEQYGSEGFKAFERTLAHAQAANLLVITDAKRNDIGSTCQAYANAHLGDVELLVEDSAGKITIQNPHPCDWLTVSPYLGSDGIVPFLEAMNKRSCGIFILVRTSNISARELQDLMTTENLPVWHKVAEMVKNLDGSFTGKKGFSSIGTVVGATYPAEAHILRTLLHHTIFLVPGYGAQGASAFDCTHSFRNDGYGALINASRSIIFAYDKQQQNQNELKQAQLKWRNAIRDATIAMRDDILFALKDNNKLPTGW